MTDKSIEENQIRATERRKNGEFVRGVSGFRHAIGDEDFPAEPNRYHLFVALNCPWCHRVSLARNILGLQNSVSMDVVFPTRTDEQDSSGSNYWEFAPNRISKLTNAPLSECTADTATGQSYRLIKEIYAAEGSAEQSVPILYDKKLKRIVNNESAEIIRIFNEHAEALGSEYNNNQRANLSPEAHSSEIEKLNTLIYTSINNGAYKAGFSSDQSVYAKAYLAYFEALNELEKQLSDGRPYLIGDALTEADVRLFPTLYRHDPVYYLRMKLNGAKILDYPHLWRWLCRMYQIPGVAESSSLTHCKQGYFGRSWNGTIPLGPVLPMPYPDAYLHPKLGRIEQ